MRDATIVTGASGFIGSHLCESLGSSGNGVRGLDLVAPAAGASHEAMVVDIGSPDQLRAAANGLSSPAIIHLAARAEVVVPFGDLHELHRTNVLGTVNLLEVFSPRLFVMASSSAVYGNGARPAVGTDWRFVRPVGTYGMTKAAAELACADWVRDTGRAAVSFRFGNVIGPRCRGLIPFLVDHARRHPDGRVPAALRGRGRILRDYIPVDYTVRLLRAAADATWPSGTVEVFNIGTGRGTTNGFVARRVTAILRRLGYGLRVDMDNPVAPGEARHVVLDMKKTVRRFGVAPPTRDEVDEAIESAVRHRIEAPL